MSSAGHWFPELSIMNAQNEQRDRQTQSQVVTEIVLSNTISEWKQAVKQSSVGACSVYCKRCSHWWFICYWCD